MTNEIIIKNLRCKHCKQSANQLLIFAMMETFGGAKVYPPSTYCYATDDNKHEFIRVK